MLDNKQAFPRPDLFNFSSSHAARSCIQTADEQMPHSSPESVIVFIPRASKQTNDRSQVISHTLWNTSNNAQIALKYVVSCWIY